MKQLIYTCLLVLSLTIFTPAQSPECGAPGIASGQITAQSPGLFSLAQPKITVSSSSGTFVLDVSPFGFYAFEIESCPTVYTVTPSSKYSVSFSPSSHMFTSGQGDVNNLDFFMFE